MKPKRRILPIFVPHLGCPHTCVFCNQHRISGSLRPVTPEDVSAAVQKAAEEMPGVSLEAAFYGGSFTAVDAETQTALLAALEPWRRAGVIGAVRVSTRPDCLGEAELLRLRRFGTETVELGVQSMDETVLRLSRRGHTGEDARLAAALVKQAGLSLVLQMMTGLPGDSREKSIRTAEQLIAMEPDGVRIYPTVVIRDTELYRLWKRGEYTPQTVEEAAELCAELWELFDRAGIPVIRCGLNPTGELSGGDAAAGAYHPAFGELVLSRRYRRAMEPLLEGCEGCAAVLGVAPGQVSAAVGQHRENVLWAAERFGLRDLKIREIGVKKGEIQRISVAKQD